MKTVLIRIFASLVLLLLLVGGGGYVWLLGSEPALPAQQLFYNGRIITMDSGDQIVSAMAVQDGRIVALGSDDDILALADSATVLNDLDGRSLLPGFIDAHGHFPGTGLSAVGIDLSSPPIGAVSSIADIQKLLRAGLSEGGDEDWLFGFGYDDSLLSEARHPTRQDLDAVSANRPIYLMHSSGHMGVVNSAGMRLGGIGIDTPDPDGGMIVRDAKTGEASGLLLEHATDLIAPIAMDFSAIDFLAMIDEAAKQYLAAGVTTVQSGGVDMPMLNGLFLASRLQRIPQRVIAWPLADVNFEKLMNGELNLENFDSDKFTASAIKLIVDGSIQGYTAYLTQPYYRQQPDQLDQDYRGFPRYQQNELNERVTALYCKGFHLALHGNGDAAIDMVIAAIRAAQQSCSRQDTRSILVHAQTARPDQLDAMKVLDISPSFFIAHTFFWGDRHRDQFLGPVRGSRISPMADAVARDMHFTVHLDSPVVPMDVNKLLWSSVTRQTRSGAVLGPEQRVSAMQALRALTIDAAWQSFKEQEIGSLEVGKIADLVLLDRDPLAGDDSLLNFKVDRVWIGGRCYFQRGADQCSEARN
ncbi:amidohydrolase [Zhongshania aquimaris]|uniref:Amidohydrolase n=1 Tax=Zhongshania aquimaris TaxID=2857107 RepID=A0ABS6VW31_9GAMM|nr:amidohydrolase [Zhongshania aquimaris]MBW2942549.1 amidohydrolase [Zhongshania aquimaris]